MADMAKQIVEKNGVSDGEFIKICCLLLYCFHYLSLLFTQELFDCYSCYSFERKD